jgi:dihydroflavonol-4-reductase
MGPLARRVPTRELPDVLVRIGALFAPAMRQMLLEVGKVKNATSAKAKRVLGWSPRSAEEALVATAESLQRFGQITPSRSSSAPA